MPLASFAYLVAFLPVVAIGAHVFRDWISARAAQVWILAASLAFYSRSGLRYLPVLILSIAFNWAIGQALMSPRFGPAKRKRLLLLGLSVDILVLWAFKYANFFLGIVGRFVGGNVTVPNWGFPLGISFFTLSQVMYLVDCYERLITPNSVFDHATFVSFLPNVTAGPLERAKHFVGQLRDLGSPENRDDRLARSIALIAMGLFKKVVLADSFARVANAGYGNVATLSTTEAWITSLAYTFQLYFDFSGYSDLAFGSSRLLGVSLVENFRAPYRARSVSEFWQRWHISLSNFITTYLYTPIVRSMGRVTIHKATIATLLAMTIAGLWHGPAWTFILFGIMHGIGLATNQYWKRVRRPLPKPVAWLATFAFINLTLIVFRSPSVESALRVARRLVSSERIFDVSSVVNAIPSAVMPMIVLPIAFGCVAAFAGPTAHEIAATFRPSKRAALGVAAIIVVSFMFMLAGTGSDFVYRAF
jgi:D-alanyl-lipoteichoic acid acyltransferase DltB (MBOAT superfamily)